MSSCSGVKLDLSYARALGLVEGGTRPISDCTVTLGVVNLNGLLKRTEVFNVTTNVNTVTLQETPSANTILSVYLNGLREIDFVISNKVITFPTSLQNQRVIVDYYYNV